jgi:hypothetical protein
MFHDFQPPPIGALACGLLAFALAACNDSDNPLDSEATDLATLRAAVQPYHDVESARGAGYDVLVSHPTNHRICLRDAELGAMGVHYRNGSLVDDTVLEDEPEVVIYEPQED